MRKQFLSLVISTTALAAAGANAHAQVVGAIEADVPFGFHAGSVTLPAGRYTVEVPEDLGLRVLRITSTDRKTGAYVEVQDTEANASPAKTELVFDRFGDQYFLSKVFDEGNRLGSEILPTKYENALRKGARGTEQRVSAQHRTRTRSSRPASGKEMTFEGEITSVNEPAQEFTVKNTDKGAAEMTFHVSRPTSLTIDGQTVLLRQLEKGDRVTVTYEATGDASVAKRVHRHKQST